MPSRGNRSTLPHASCLGQRGRRLHTGPCDRDWSRWSRVDLRSILPDRSTIVLRGFRPPDRCPSLPRGTTDMKTTGRRGKRQVGARHGCRCGLWLSAGPWPAVFWLSPPPGTASFGRQRFGCGV